MAAVDLLLNNITAVTTLGGNSTPAQNTAETWHVASSTGWTAILTGLTEVRIVDIAAPGEIILLTNVAALIWSVTRGVEGTAPTSHAVGSVFAPVITSGSLNSWLTGNAAALLTAVFNAGANSQIQVFEGIIDPGGAANEGALWFDA